ncbi:MAG: hypothetical protein ABH863_05390, partial [Candidatus Micrarchaeota archaeon]
MALYKSMEDAYYGFMDFLDQKLHIPVYNSFVNPIEKGGTPSFPVFLILLLLVFGGIAGAFYYFGVQQQQATLKVMVLSGEDAVPGASVRIVSGDLEFSAESDDDGFVAFEKLPKGKTFTIEVTADDYEPGSDEITLEDTRTLEINLAGIPKETIFTVSIEDDAGAPVTGVKILYSAGSRSGNTVSGANGNSRITVPKDSEVSLEASKEGYDTAYGSTSSSTSTYRMTLRKKSVPQPVAEKGKLKVTVQDESGKKIEGTVSVFESTGSATPLDVQDTENGEAIFYELEVGMRLKITASAKDYTEEKVFETMKADTRVIIKLKTDNTPPPKDVTLITAKDGKSKSAIEGATVYLFKPEDELVFEEKTDSSGRAIFADARLAPYYAIATASGYVYSKIFLTGGEQKEILLYKEGDQLTGELTIYVADEDGKKVANAKISMYDEAQDVVPPFDQKTNAKGEYKLKLPLAYYTAKVTSGALYGENSIDLEGDELMNITLSYPRGLLSLSALDLDSNRSILNNLTSSYKVLIKDKVKRSENTTTCTVNPCRISLIADRSYDLELTAVGYYPATSQIISKEIKAEEVTNRSILMKNTSSPTNLRLVFDGLLDLQNPNAPVTEAIPGKVYALRLNAFFDNTSSKGIYLRVGEELELQASTNSSADGYINEYSMSGSPTASNIRGANYYLPDICSPTPSPAKARWAFADYSLLGSGLLLVSIKTNAAKKAPENLDLFVSAYSVLSNGTLFSDPSGAQNADDCSAPRYTSLTPFVKTGGAGERCNSPPLRECDDIEYYCDEANNTCVPEPRINPADFCDEEETLKVFSMKDGGAMVVSKYEEEGTNFYTRKGELYKNCPGDDTTQQAGDCRSLFNNRSTTTPVCDKTIKVDPNSYCTSGAVTRVDVCADGKARVTSGIDGNDLISYFKVDGELFLANCPADPAPTNTDCFNLQASCNPAQTIKCAVRCPNDIFVKDIDYCRNDNVAYVSSCPTGYKVVSDMNEDEQSAGFYDVCGLPIIENCAVDPAPSEVDCYLANRGCSTARMLCKLPPELLPPDFRECPAIQIVKKVSGNLKATCPRVVMKVDSIFPADGIQIGFLSEDGTQPLQRIEFYDGLLKVDACFEYDVANGLLKYDPSRTGCSDKYKAVGNKIASANFTMKVYISPIPTALVIPIIVLNDEGVPLEQRVGFPAIDSTIIEYKKPDTTPASFYGFSTDYYGPLRLGYVINNRQKMVPADDLGGGKYSGSTSYNEFISNILLRSNYRGSASLFSWDTNSKPILSIAAKIGG